jgi:DNA-binding transcriptional MerR regulator
MMQMDAKVLTTEKVARILGVPEWRVVRFAQIKKYGITPAYGQASGSGSRRLYNVENVCEMALASWLTEAGLRIEVIARVLTQVRNQGGLARYLDENWEQETLHTYLAIVRKPKGKPTSKVMSQDAVFIRDWEWLGKTLAQEFFSSALVIDIGRRFWILSRVTAWKE